VLNDSDLGLLQKTAVSQVKAGVDIIAPSGMMDGFVQAIRQGLDEAGYSDTPILSYTAKYAFCLLLSVSGCGGFYPPIWRSENLPKWIRVMPGKP
jgi:hypothetical protein